MGGDVDLVKVSCIEFMVFDNTKDKILLKLFMFVHIWYLIYKIYLVSFLVRGITWIRVI